MYLTYTDTKNIFKHLNVEQLNTSSRKLLQNIHWIMQISNYVQKVLEYEIEVLLCVTMTHFANIECYLQIKFNMVTAHGESWQLHNEPRHERRIWIFTAGAPPLLPRENWRESAGCVLNEACQQERASSILISCSCLEMYEKSSAMATIMHYYPALVLD